MRSTVSLRLEAPSWLPERRVAQVALVCFLVVALGSALGLWSALASLSTLPTLCPIRATTGVECPGCGMGRALALLADGNLRASLQRHPFALPVLGWLALQALLPASREQPGPRKRRFPAACVVPAAATLTLLAWWAFRTFF